MTTDGKIAWRVWVFDRAGELQKITGYELDPDSPAWSAYTYRPGGALLYRHDHIHDEYGLLEVVTYDGDGKLINREDAD